MVITREKTEYGKDQDWREALVKVLQEGEQIPWDDDPKEDYRECRILSQYDEDTKDWRLPKDAWPDEKGFKSRLECIKNCLEITKEDPKPNEPLTDEAREALAEWLEITEPDEE
ncbi:hypothetical protein ACFL06_00745 [Patescibacteria group bacterium]